MTLNGVITAITRYLCGSWASYFCASLYCSVSTLHSPQRSVFRRASVITN